MSDLTLPDPLTLADGSRVASAEEWRARRRPELLEFFSHEMYGCMPGRPENMTFALFEEDANALGGIATRRQVSVLFTGKPDGPRVDVLIYVPNGRTKPAPAFLSLNFQGNHTVHSDTAIRLPTSWMPTRAPGVEENRATEAGRAVASSRWPIELILERGYAVATAYYGDIDPDYDDGFQNGIHAEYPEFQGRGDNFTSIGAWAWGLQRILDYLETNPNIDASRVAVVGHSRLGKAALWAGATDERFALTISNDSGAGGAKLFHRGIGESIERLNTVFPHWFCGNFRQYNEQDTALPFDQHMVLALIAPRPVYVASASEDLWADPEGEFLATVAADPIYRFLGAEGMPAKSLPGVDQPVHGDRVGYHVRSGKHDITAYDWEQFIAFMDTAL